MTAGPTRVGPRLEADRSRVIARLFVPGEEASDSGSRVHLVIDRVRALPERQVAAELATIRAAFADRHRHLDDILRHHASLVSARLHDTHTFSDERQLLVGAYLTQEYAVEGAALCNPSMVDHPDQSGVPAGQTRFLMSVRAVGEGHLSSVEFRTGLVGPGTVVVDDPGTTLTPGSPIPTSYDKQMVVNHLFELGTDPATARQVLSELPDTFTDDDLRRAMTDLHPRLLGRPAAQQAVKWVTWIASNHYELTFPADVPIGEQLLWPTGAAESHGMEDVRLVRFVDDDGTAVYYGTYTAFDGDHVAPHLLATEDFHRYRMSQLAGPAARNKGLALFPRRVSGQQLALSRWDRENITLASSVDGHRWEPGPVVHATVDSWEFVQVGNCGSPIETEAGWLVLTHGVGPMRTYTIGAILLDLDKPDRVLARSTRPILQPEANERDGYVPNVVYSCGALRHGETLTIPYGIGDVSIGFAQVQLSTLLDLMQ